MDKEIKVAKKTAKKRAKRRRYEKHRNLLNNRPSGVIRRSKPIIKKTKVVEVKKRNFFQRLLDLIKKICLNKRN